MSSSALGFGVRLVYGVGMGLTVAPVTESIMGSLPTTRAGVGSAVNDTTRQTGGALGVAILGSILAARYHSVIRGAKAIPASVASGVHDSIGSALSAARGLPASQASIVQHAAVRAYLSGM